MVDYRVDGNIAVLEINNPPVNALSINVREGIFDGVKRANTDNKVKAIILIGKGRTFPSGADIREFGKAIKGPWLVQVGHTMEASDKPVISAMHGTALGGGLEIALFSHYRIADKKTKVGFPEVLLGLIPGAEGAVRLPRVAGIEVSMEMVSSGRHVSAPEAFKSGILDAIVEGDLLNEAKKFAASVIGKPLDPRRLSKVAVPGAENVDKLYEVALTHVTKKYKGMISPMSCLKAVRAAAKLPFLEASEFSVRTFKESMDSAESAALRYAFFAERVAPRWTLPCGASASNTKPEVIKSTAVIGAGTMGSGIAVCLIRVGIPVILVEQNEKMLESGIRTITRVLEGSVKLKRMTLEQKNNCLHILRGASGLEQLADVDLVIEAVFENLKLKQEIFAKLDKICKPSTLLCTNTSTLDIDQIASATNRPDKVIGTHFFSPAYIMKLLENVYGSKTSPTTVATVTELGKRIGKIPVLVKTCHAFVANRMNQRLGSEMFFMLEEGALPQDIDRVLEDFGVAMGPCKVSDLAGVDVGWRIRQEVAKALGTKLTLETRIFNGERYCSLPDRLYEMGRYGIKTGKGWYKYEMTSGRKAIPDPDVTEMILDHCKSLGITRKEIPPQEIIERIMYAVVNEGFRILEEGVAEKPEDIDVIWLYGFSYPRYRGGPMFYASQVGLKRVYERICHYHATFPYSSYWVPSDLLKKLASHDQKIPMDKWTTYSYSRL